MDILDAIEKRHSVRKYENKPIDAETVKKLQEEIKKINSEGDMHIQLILDEPKAFYGSASYDKFVGVTNYIAIIGKNGKNFEERSGYFGERLVLFAQSLGLNSCWVAMTYTKIPEVFQIEKQEKLSVVIALGYGETQGIQHKSKAFEDVSSVEGEVPEWFKKGVDAALLAPTALNQQKFKFLLQNGKVATKAGIGFYTKIDLGIAKYHFEVAAGKENFEWAN